MPLKVSDRLLCGIAAGFMEEFNETDPDVAHNLRSSNFLHGLHRKSKTRHENASARTFQKEGLSCPIPTVKVDVGGGKEHPVLKIKDLLKALDSVGKIPLLWGSESATSRTDVLPKFWRRWRLHDGGHEVFQTHRQHLDMVLPVQIHADEGQTLKKSGVMILNWQSPIGFGVSTQNDVPAAMSLNYVGNSYATRFLYTACTKRTYSKKNAFILDGIFESLADELKDLFHNGVTLKLNGAEEKTYFLALIGIKGDWPVQARIGNLVRHFARKGVYEVSEKSGFCHLCRAGEAGYDANDYTAGAAWRSTYLKFPPWTVEGAFCKVPQSCAKEFMHKFDVFHTLHKGCFAELAASSIATRLNLCIF